MSSFNMSKDIPASFLILFNQTDSFKKKKKKPLNSECITVRLELKELPLALV